MTKHMLEIIQFHADLFVCLGIFIILFQKFFLLKLRSHKTCREGLQIMPLALMTILQ